MSADRNLLFGLIALKMDFITREQLLDAMSAWLDRKADPLGVVLQERGAIVEGDRRVIDAVLDRQVERHGDVAKSLAAVRVESSVRSELEQIADDDVRRAAASLAPPSESLHTVGPPGEGPARPRYRRLRHHARGGLGEVSVALDEELRREVALKEIQGRHADHLDSRLRFVREAEVTGNLEHPGVVPVYGLGTYPDGRPYYAMRFIRGESMDKAIERYHAGPSEMALRGLLGRFVAVCNAVGYAHSRGVIHRDLKPANVMLGDYGETLVVDWGLAKVMDQPEETGSTERPLPVGSGGSAPTQMGQAVGTPAFMPPEQAKGEHDREGTHSDIFSLGATLYNLLTGRPPYSSLADAERGQFRPARQVNREVPAALEAVCAEAMAVRPEGRYATARELAAEVERWLADAPVAAQREPWREKARRWAKRNRSVVSGGVVLLAASVVGLAIGLGAVNAEKAKTTGQRDRAESAEGLANARLVEVEANLKRAVKAEEKAKENLKRAEANLALAKTAVDECYGVAKDHPLLKGPMLSDELYKLKRLLLEKALPFYKEFRARHPGDRGVERDVWEQHYRVGYIQSELGSQEEALANYRQAEQVARQLVKAQPNGHEQRYALAGTLINLGLLQTAFKKPLVQRDRDS